MNGNELPASHSAHSLSFTAHAATTWGHRDISPHCLELAEPTVHCDEKHNVEATHPASHALHIDVHSQSHMHIPNEFTRRARDDACCFLADNFFCFEHPRVAVKANVFFCLLWVGFQCAVLPIREKVTYSAFCNMPTMIKNAPYLVDLTIVTSVLIFSQSSGIIWQRKGLKSLSILSKPLSRQILCST